MNNLVSVIIPTYNFAKYVCEAVDSVLKQTYKNFELILVDDGSTDNTLERLKQYGNRISYLYQENKGLASARNKGIKASCGIYIAFLDADDIWLPKKIERQIEILEKDQTVSIVGCGCYFVDDDGIIIGKKFGNTETSRNILLQDLMIRNVMTGSGSGVIVKKDCFDKVGFFDESLKSTEDRDMWARIIKYYNAAFVHEPLIKIRLRRNSLSTNVKQMKLSQRKFILKHFNDMNKKTKVKAYSYVYLCAANEYYSVSNKWHAAMNAFMAIIKFPFKICEGDNKYRLLISSFIPNEFKKIISNLKYFLNKSCRNN